MKNLNNNINMRTLKIFVTLTLITLLSFGQNPNREYISHKQEDRKFEVITNDGKYIFQTYSNSIVETAFIPKGQNYNPNSHAVIMSPEKVQTTYSYVGNDITYGTSGISVTVTTSPFKVRYSYKGNPVISEKAGYVKNDSLETIQFNLTKDEVLYGGGARALGMNRRGNRLQLYNRAHYGYETHSELMNFTMPLVMSSNKYIIHFDNAPIGFLDLDSKKDNTLTYETISGRKTYQVIVGDSWVDLIDNYTDLTGKQPMPPRWALGNFSSRFGYHSQQETEATIDKFKEEEIPVDAVIIDIYWFGKKMKGTMGNLEFLKDSFPNPKKMIKILQQKGVKTVLVTEPFVLSTSNRWQEAVDKDVLAKDSLGNPFRYDFYFGNTGLIDIYSKKGNDWFWNIYKDLANLGVKGFWGDLGEPEVHPSELIHATGTADEVHNIYGHDWARLVHEGYTKDFPNERPFILMRAGYSGSQRYGLIPWSGDVNRTWGGLQSQPEIALQMGMQGIGYMHSDLGGFAGANLDDELYTRWLQYGVFQPIYRPHAQEEVPSEPVYREETTKQLAKESIELRYKLLPYNYTLAFDNNQNGTPLMRPLFFDEPDNKMLQEDDTAYFWGDDFLIAPIKSSGEQSKVVYLTSCSNWFNFYTDEFHKGGKPISAKAQSNYIPTYVRAGAFIPMAKLVQSTDDYSLQSFDWHYYHHESVKEGYGRIYNDDGLTKDAFEKGEYEILLSKSEACKKSLEIEFMSIIGSNYSSEEKQINLIIHNIDKAPKRIKVNREKVESSFDSVKKTLTIPVNWKISDDLELKIKFKK